MQVDTKTVIINTNHYNRNVRQNNKDVNGLLIDDFTMWSEMMKPFAAIMSVEFSDHCGQAMKLSVRQPNW